MLRDVLTWSAIAAAALLWAAGVRLFVAATMAVRWKVIWSAFLLAVGCGIGFALSLHDLRTKVLWVVVILPIVAAADVLVLRAKRGFRYWIRACGFEVVTVFGAAAITRVALDLVRIAPLVEPSLE